MPAIDRRRAACAMRIGSPSSVIAPPSERIDAEDGAGELGAPGADQPGEAEDLAACGREGRRRGPDRCAVRSLDDVEHAVARRRRRRHVERLEVAADHQADHRGRARSRRAVELADHARRRAARRRGRRSARPRPGGAR